MNARLAASDPQASLFSVPDPTDWDDTKLPLLNPLESALRCDICKDFYNSPVITNCFHTFCSVCIRRALRAESTCPVCRTTEQEYRLRKNLAVQELLDAFLSARPRLLEVAREIVWAADPPSTQEEDEERDEEEGEEEEEVGKKEKQKQNDRSPPAKRPKSLPRTTRSTRSIPRYTEEHTDDTAEIPVSSDGLVSCPSCQKRIKMDTMNPHLDGCLSESEYKPTSRSSLSVRNYATRSSKSASLTPPTLLQPLPKINYSFLKDNALRNKLAELGIPSHGARKLLQERHSEWMTIWNANVDANQPRRKNELLADLASWEKAHLRPSNQPAKAQWSDDQWKNKHEDQFGILIAEAKTRAAAARKKTEENAAKEVVQKGVANSFAEGVGAGACGSSEQSKDVNSMTEARSTKLLVPTAPGLSVDRLSNSGVSMTTVESKLGFDMVASQMDGQWRGQDRSRINGDPPDLPSNSGKRKHNEIDGASLTGVVKNGIHK